MGVFIHQKDNWPEFTWNSASFLDLLSEARNLQGRLIGKMETLGFDLRNEGASCVPAFPCLGTPKLKP